MFAYCGNNPVMGYDPAGYWDWGGVIVGIGIIAATVITVATCGVGTPVAALVAAAAITTGAVTTYAAATDSTMVVDLSYSAPGGVEQYGKVGGTFLVDFKNDEFYFYPHAGYGNGYSSGFSYAPGIVSNYDSPDDYSELFADVNGGFYMGMDHCWDPRKDHDESPQATSITFGMGTSFGSGFDWYCYPILLGEW